MLFTVEIEGFLQGIWMNLGIFTSPILNPRKHTVKADPFILNKKGTPQTGCGGPADAASFNGRALVVLGEEDC